MKISVEKSCYMIFEKKTKVKTNLNLKINGNSLNNEEKVKFLGITLDSKLTFSPMKMGSYTRNISSSIYFEAEI
ncbi:hypothetical protein BpHYR1_005167 [Brachionus plicatilis]|uniref:Uncharacterized protein n=1 Tax=Brachionus plicatilis TaxID=10195 RepID=A0A3M7RIY6_BRAPC|nr:hypothetical protein BpHYR1_005167 [Brachionus plicatilis]